MMDIIAQVIAIGSTLALASLVVLGAFYLIIKYYDKNRTKSTLYTMAAFLITVTLQIVLFFISLRGQLQALGKDSAS